MSLHKIAYILSVLDLTHSVPVAKFKLMLSHVTLLKVKMVTWLFSILKFNFKSCVLKMEFIMSRDSGKCQNVIWKVT